VELRSNQITPSLPPQFYTEASLVSPFTKIKFNPAMFALFLTLQVFTMVFSWGVLFWLWLGPRVATKMSLWSVFDVAYNTKVQGEDDVRFQRLTTSEIIGVMKTAQVHTRD
jgi:hypothetical protein